jgi:hypothetical protein
MKNRPNSGSDRKLDWYFGLRISFHIEQE